MNYQFIYDKIIFNAKSKNRKKLKKTDNDYVYYELHHIKPKSLFPELKNDKNNLVLLTAKEHYICHLLLEKIYPNSNMFLALWRLATDDQNQYVIKGSKEFERLRTNYKISDIHRQHIKDASKKLWTSDRAEEVRAKIKKARALQSSDTLKGIKRTPEQCKRISEKTKLAIKNLSDEKRNRMINAAKGRIPSNKGSKLTDEQKDKISNSVKMAMQKIDKYIFNTLIINDGKEEKRISRKKKELQYWLNLGWKKGHLNNSL